MREGRGRAGPKLETRGLRVFYGQREVLRGVSLAVPDRSVVALIGPSGCGKSTFLRSLNRMHDLTPGARVEGRILLDGRPIERLDPRELRCRVGMVFQRPNPFPMSIYQNVAFGPALFGVRGQELDRIVVETLRRAALWDEVKDRLHQDARGLSGGQQQRLCLARALAMEPEVLLMDEPCAALDPAATEAVEALIGELRRRMAVVVVTHSMAQARRVADRVAFFDGGRLVEEGPAAEVLTRPRCAETRRFLAHAGD
ncbi:MAG: phosphate ABC transporter ATP-binding protein [Symbiobacterium sp.]|uniref:phosphate ABC transporter ATP-binding protein n=1 Tax=Symbiobacterium sp. TaxID=1971213 RepID=UPI00346462E8